MGLAEVFVGDLSYFCTEADLSKWLEAIGPIQNVVIKKDRNGNSLLYGFVHFCSVSSAKRAVRILNGQKFMGRTIIVHETSTRAPKKDYSRWFKINVYFGSYSILKIEEELLHNVFSRFGDVQDVVIRDHTIHPLIEGLQWVCGYGVVFFPSEDDAIQAVECMDNYIAEMIHFTCTYKGRVSQAQQNEDQLLILDSRGSEAAMDSPSRTQQQQLSLLQRRWLGYAEHSPLVIREYLKKSALTSVATSSAFMTIASNMSTSRGAISFASSPSMLPPPKSGGRGPRGDQASNNYGYISNYSDHIHSSRNLYPPPQQSPSSHIIPRELPHFHSTANSSLPPRDVMTSRSRSGFPRHDQSANSGMNNIAYIPESFRRECTFDAPYRRINYESEPYAHQNARNFPGQHYFEPNDLDYYRRGNTTSGYSLSASNNTQTTRNVTNAFDHGVSETSLFAYKQSQQHSREYNDRSGSLYATHTPPFHESDNKSHLR